MGQAIRIVRVKVDGVELNTKPDTVKINLGQAVYTTVESNRPGETYQRETRPGMLEADVFVESGVDLESLFGVSKTVHAIADNNRQWKMGAGRSTKEGEIDASNGTISLGYEGTPWVKVVG